MSTSSSCDQSTSPTSSSSPAPSVGRSWRANILAKLQQRNRRETQPFTDLVCLQNRLLERSSSLIIESGQVLFINEKLKEENQELKNKLLSNTNDCSNERVSMLEKKLFGVQEELTELHRRRGENAQKIIDQATLLRDNLNKLDQANQELLQLRKEMDESRSEVLRLQMAINELEATNQLLKDEYQTLQLALSSAEQKLVATQKENDQLIAQILELKDRDVRRINEENDRLRQKQQLLLKQQLEEAAREKAVVPVTSNTRINVGQQGAACIDPVMCCTVQIPTKAYITFKAHDGEVNAIKWSPHGLAFATGGSDRKIKLWDISRGVADNQGLLTGSNGAITSIDFDSAGSLLLAASVSDFTCRVWTLDNQRLRHTLTGHSGKVMSAKFMSDNNKVVSGSYDRTLKVWDLQSKACIHTKFAGSSCNDLVCCDSNIISGHFDRKVRFWDTRTGTQPVSEVELNGKVTSLDLAHNGVLLLASLRTDLISLIDLRTNKVLHDLSADNFRIGYDWARAAFSPDSEYVCAGSIQGDVFIWNVQSPCAVETVLSAHNSTVIAVDWQPAGHSLTSCDKNNEVIVWARI